MHIGPDNTVDMDLPPGILGQLGQLGPEPLHNAKNPYYHIQRERFEHRIICFLKAEGYSNIDIAKRTGMSAVAISNIIRQPWAQKQILDIIHDKGGDAVSALLNGAAADAVQRLIIEKDNMEARASERILAADKILDRAFGKPNQPLQYSTADTKKLSDEELETIVRRGTRGSISSTDPQNS